MEKQWFETWFDSPYYHLLYKNRDNSEAAKFMDELISFLNADPGAYFIDLACGKGRHSVHLHKKGFKVTGLDFSSNNVSYAQMSSDDSLNFFRHDMRESFPVSEADYIVNLFTSFGYFESDHEHVQTIRNINAALRNKGIFVIDYLNSSWVLDALRVHETKSVDNIVFNIRKELTDGFIVKTIEFVYNGSSKSFQEKVRAFSEEDLVSMLTSNGFTIENVFGNYSLDPFDRENSERLIIIARKC